VSYRWGSTEENAWVAALAVELKRRGYPVIFDQDQPQGDNVDVPGMVSRLAECRYVLCVIDPGYVERLGHEPGSSTKDGWVFDEVNTASAFSNAGRLALIGLLRDGDQLPQGFSFMGPNQRGNSVDVRGSNRLAAFLNDVLPELPGEHDTATVAAARAALADSHAAYLAGDPERAFAEAARVTALLPDAPDGYAQTIRLALRPAWARATLWKRPSSWPSAAPGRPNSMPPPRCSATARACSTGPLGTPGSPSTGPTAIRSAASPTRSSATSSTSTTPSMLRSATRVWLSICAAALRSRP